MAKFKIGDRVVAPGKPPRAGVVIVAAEHIPEFGRTTHTVQWDDSVGQNLVDIQDELELEEIYNSPLYRALQEEEL